LFFFFNDPPTTQIYTLSLHDALPIFEIDGDLFADNVLRLKINDSIPDLIELFIVTVVTDDFVQTFQVSPTHRSGLGQENYVIKRSEEHTSELQSRENLVCRLLLEKKK